MGAADTVPGVSGGTIAFISGIYEELLTTSGNVNISLFKTWTSQGFNASIIPSGANAGTMRTALQFYGSGMSNLTNTSSAHSL